MLEKAGIQTLANARIVDSGSQLQAERCRRAVARPSTTLDGALD
jgi:hypothetical protein